MKIQFAKNSTSQGSILLVSIVVASIAGITLASYLILAQNQTVSIQRSQTWNTVMPVSEAGVEDALQLINRYSGSMEPEDLPKWTNHIAESNWDSPAAGVYHVKRYMPCPAGRGLWVTNSYEVWITNTANEPKIYAKAEVPWTFSYSPPPQQSFASFAAIGVPTPVFAQVNVGGGSISVTPDITSDTVQSGHSLVRNVGVKCTYDPMIGVAMAALETIDLRGRNISSDSFDSSRSDRSTGGKYPMYELDKTRDEGTIATASSIIDSLNLGNAKVRGKVRTGPGYNTMEIGPNGSVGNRSWVEGTRGIQQGWASTDFNVVFPSVTEPEVTWIPVAPVDWTDTNGVTYQYVFETEGWYTPSTPITGNVLFNAPTNHIIRLQIETSVTLSGGDRVIRIADTGCKVRIYMAGAQFSLTGGARVDNVSGVADRFFFYGYPSCRGILFGGNAHFYGGIYAPQAAFALGGGGNDTWDFVGGSVTRTVQMNGHYRFHYDEALRLRGPGRGYIPVSWNER